MPLTPIKLTFLARVLWSWQEQKLEEAIQAGWSEAEIRASWASQLDAFKRMRSQYLLYPN